MSKLENKIKKTTGKWYYIVIAIALVLIAFRQCANSANIQKVGPKPTPNVNIEKVEAGKVDIKEDGEYTSRDEVAAYLHEYKKLPKNYVTKAEAQKAGYDADKNDLSDILPGKSIGGSIFGNYEGLLPKVKGRKYYECDIDYKKGNRNAKRLVFSNDGLIFYTDDHYKTFVQLY